jgi:hypothetical protein
VPVPFDGGQHAVEDRQLDAVRRGRRLQQKRLHRGEERRLGHPARAVRAQIAGHLAGAHAEPDQHHIGQFQRQHQAVEVGGEGVVVVPRRRSGRPAEAAAVVGDYPVAGGQQARQLLLPGSAVERVAVDQYDRPAGAVILVVELDVGGVLLADPDERHGGFLLVPAVSLPSIGSDHPAPHQSNNCTLLGE